jgi:hypothetical protein
MPGAYPPSADKATDSVVFLFRHAFRGLPAEKFSPAGEGREAIRTKTHENKQKHGLKKYTTEMVDNRKKEAYKSQSQPNRS